MFEHAQKHRLRFVAVNQRDYPPSSHYSAHDMQELADELPEHAPRFVLLSYPLTLVRCFPLISRIGVVTIIMIDVELTHVLYTAIWPHIGALRYA